MDGIMDGTNWELTTAIIPESSPETNDSNQGEGINLMPWDEDFHNLSHFKVISLSLMVLTIVAINLAMGALFDTSELRRRVRFPTGMIVGCLAQFIIFPTLALAVSRSFGLSDDYSVGMMIAAVSPSSSVANLFTFFVDGNVCLSVAMTITSTIVAIGMIPSMLFILTNAFSMEMITVPLFTLSAAILIIFIPLVIGLFMHQSLKPKWTRLAITISLAIGFACYITNTTIQLIFNKEAFDAPFGVYGALACLPVISYGLGYGIGLFFGEDAAGRRALGFSIVFHNISITLLSLSTVITDKEAWFALITFPTLYGTIVALYGFVGTVLYHMCCPDEDFINNNQTISEYQVIRNGSDEERMTLVGRGGEFMRMEPMSVPTTVEERRNTARF